MPHCVIDVRVDPFCCCQRELDEQPLLRFEMKVIGRSSDPGRVAQVLDRSLVVSLFRPNVRRGAHDRSAGVHGPLLTQQRATVRIRYRRLRVSHRLEDEVRHVIVEGEWRRSEQPRTAVTMVRHERHSLPKLSHGRHFLHRGS